MNKTLIITLGILLIVAILGLWVYLLFFGTPKNANDVFADLGFSEREELPRPTETFNTALVEEDATVDITSSALVQLTTRQVAGAMFLHDAGGAPVAIRYAERGVGHVYEIDLASGVEERVSGKTFAAVIDATFSPDGEAVALTTEAEFGTASYVEDLVRSESHDLPLNARDIAFLTDTELRYAVANEDGTAGYRYDLDGLTTETLFTIPFTDATIVWQGDATFTYNRPAPYLEGGLYSISDGLSRIGETAYGLTSLPDPYDERYIMTYVDARQNVLTSHLLDTDGATTTLPVVALPEKCTFDPLASATVWCAAPLGTLPRTYQTDWYKGTTSFSDLLWEVDIPAQEAVLVSDLAGETGREIDVTGLVQSADGSHLMFTNKRDGALWLYRIVDETPPETGATDTSATSSATVVEIGLE